MIISKLRTASADGNTINIKYDPFGNRIWRKVTGENARKYIVDISGDLPVILMELDPDDNNDIETSYVYANARPLCMYNHGGSVDVYFYITDRLGSVRLVLDDANNVKNTYTYDPFGQLFATESTEATENRFKFTGQWYDSEFGQYWLRARMYDPALGRLTAYDPVKGKYNNPLSLHPYLYCQNDSVNRTDPSGKLYGLGSLLVNSYFGNYLRKMDFEFHMSLFERCKGKIDIISMMNLQRGVMYDMLIDSFESDFQKTVVGAGIEGLKLISPNLARIVGVAVEAGYKEAGAIIDVLQGNQQLDDFIGEELAETIITELGY